MSYYSEKRLRYFSDPVDEEILDRLDRIEAAVMAMARSQGLVTPQAPFLGGPAMQDLLKKPE